MYMEKMSYIYITLTIYLKILSDVVHCVFSRNFLTTACRCCFTQYFSFFYLSVHLSPSRKKNEGERVVAGIS